MKSAKAWSSASWPHRVTLVSLIAVAAGTAACSTPQSARDLASQGAVAVANAQSEVEGFVDQAQKAYARREAIVQGLAASNIADVHADLYRASLSARAGMPNHDTLVNLIKDIADARKALRVKFLAEQQRRASEISKTFGEPVKVPAESLNTAKKAFLGLAEELTPKEWLEFAWKYASDLQADLKKVKKELDAAAATQP
jgi:hypothetical protein